MAVSGQIVGPGTKIAGSPWWGLDLKELLVAGGDGQLSRLHRDCGR